MRIVNSLISLLCIDKEARALNNGHGGFGKERTRKVFCSILLFATSFGLLLHAQVPAGPSRPAQVPDGYVITPFGYFHPSCVKELEKGTTLRANEHAIRHTDGSQENILSCAFPKFTASGERVSGESVVANLSDVKIPTIGRSWVENAGWGDDTKVYGGITAYWYVPPVPNSNDGQTLFYFPGLVNSQSPQIFQPVLGWNADSNNPQWSISSWSATVLYNGNNGGNLYPDGNAYHSPFVNVSPGDLIQGTVQANQSACPAGTLHCNSWNVTTSDETSGTSTEASDLVSDGPFDQAYAGVLEVYNLAQCSDYPPNGSVTFSNVALYDNNYNPVSVLFWSPQYTSGLLPQCAYYVQQTPTHVALYAGVPETLTVSVSGSGTVTSTNQFGGTPISCPGACSATVTQGSYIALSASATSGYIFTGWSGACTGAGTCSLYMTGAENVTATFTPPTFTISPISTSTHLSLGHTQNYTFNVSALNGFTGMVTLSDSGLPSGVTGGFSPPSINLTSTNTSGITTLTLTAAYSESTYTGGSTGTTGAQTGVTVTGTSGSLANSTNFSLTTQPLQYKGACGVQ